MRVIPPPIESMNAKALLIAAILIMDPSLVAIAYSRDSPSDSHWDRPTKPTDIAAMEKS
jgi:hypothetical protein